jgi:GxxExxY protein
MPLIESELTQNIIAACIEVSNELGTGFLESAYENAVIIALKDKGLSVESQVPIQLSFRNQIIGKYYCDILINDRVILEIKVCKNLLSEHHAQLLNYLKASGRKIGLLVNFGKPRLEWKRFVQ